VPREPGPIQLESLSMPPDRGVRLDEYQGSFPARSHTAQHHPEKPVKRSNSRLRMFSLQNGQLLTQGRFSRIRAFRERQYRANVPAKSRSRRSIRSVLHAIHRDDRLVDIPDLKAVRYFSDGQPMARPRASPRQLASPTSPPLDPRAVFWQAMPASTCSLESSVSVNDSNEMNARNVFTPGVVNFVAVKASRSHKSQQAWIDFRQAFQKKAFIFCEISTGFNKSFDLLWEQRVGGSNPSAPTSIFNYLQGRKWCLS
jgi:hypothetical protein